ncbi:MAG: protoheme IX farnesyltransferase [Planctomycetales bacterium]|nr:protoheme IX farnesyltransferase [Planctomycetales bacterium]NIM08849.1 protoheme IX farnesyltransferase [Planctomycetales bacterium]NIN08312.1 protoheme IX farnesyltransferase [Planctomycetales bacterium]NIN77441.1 protoheme IX farnesyltransferase [Planctomycetales bacterium]NIO34613.1 protoheme IX farnesyltransferase [Planctomycetales bacterium]
MSTSAALYEVAPVSWLLRGWALVELSKPKIALLELMTVAVAACIASSGLPADGWLLLHALGGTALVASSASALNQWLERDTDGRMARTARRPLPAGRLTDWEVLAFAAATVLGGTAYLALAVNLLTAGLGLLTWTLYVWIYTPLKTRTTLNTLVGAVAGAGPVLMGWTAAQPETTTREAGLMAATLFCIVFLWQFPHFMAIAWLYRRQYAAAGARMMTVVEPTGRIAGVQAVLAAALLVPVSLYPSVLMKTGPLYVALVLALSLAQLGTAVRFLARPDDPAARRLLRMSLIYLPAQFGLLLLTPFVFPWL